MDKIKKEALKNSLLTALYIALVGGGMFYISTFKKGPDNSFLAPVAFLCLFVLSASITSFLIFGKPAQLYVDGKKKEALSLLFSTLSFFAVITVVSLALLFFLT